MLQVAWFWMMMTCDWVFKFPIWGINQINQGEKNYIGSWLHEGPNWSILFLVAFELSLCNLRALIQLYSNVKLHGLLVNVYSKALMLSI